MSLETIMVLVLVLAAAVFLALCERNSRRNEAKLKAASSAKAEPDQSPERPLEAKSRQESTRRSLHSFDR
jgi:hypothetical protein